MHSIRRKRQALVSPVTSDHPRKATDKAAAAKSAAPTPLVYHGLSGAHYCDPAQLQREMETVFASGWVALCREDEVGEQGAFLATQLHGESVVVVRDKIGELRVLSNVCRHRGMLLAAGKGVVERLSCPYHAWTYALDGQLLGAPMMQDRVDKLSCSLPQFKTFCWGGFVFANPDRETRMPGLQLLEDSISAYEISGFHTIDIFEEIWPCNWKSLVENFMDAYHLSVVHPASLRSLTPSHLSRKGVHDEHFTSYTAHYAKTAPPRRNHAPGLSDAERRQSHLFCIYPSTVASVSADTLAFFLLQPDGADQVRVRWGLASYEAKLSAREHRFRIEKWQQINAEDHAVLEALQHGLQSRRYEPGPLAPPDLEGCIGQFHNWYRSKVT